MQTYLRIFLLSALLFLNSMIQAQCYEALRTGGIDLYNSGEYEQALKWFKTARECEDTPVPNDLESWIRKTNSSLSTQNEDRVYQNAVSLNNLEAYERYILNYPEGKYVNTVAEKIKDLLKKSIEWVNIPAGTFTMGSPSYESDRDADEIQHQVTLSAFKMSKYEVTFAQYDIFCEATGREKLGDKGWGRGNRPVINVSWHDAKAFADWMGCRLPTEAEWEYACRAGTTTPYNTGNCLSAEQANYNGNVPFSNCDKGQYREKTMPVGSFAANSWGLYDMHGNVWEWCSNWYGAYPAGAQTNPQGPLSGSSRVGRGGGWSGGARYCRSAYRGDGDPAYRSGVIGFRLVSPK